VHAVVLAGVEGRLLLVGIVLVADVPVHAAAEAEGSRASGVWKTKGSERMKRPPAWQRRQS
jgi:hypothetical protein